MVDLGAPPTARPELTATEVVSIVQAVARELHPNRKARAVSLESVLDRDLGFDSLGRVELIARLERTFGVRLGEAVLAGAESPADLLRAVAVAERGSAVESFAPASVAGGGQAAPDSTRSLVEVLLWHAERHQERRHILFYPDGEEPQELTYGGLLARAKAVAAGLAALGVRRERAVGVMLPSGLDYFAAFFGIQWAGGIPVPLYPPTRLSQIEDHLRRQAGILSTAGAEVLITFPEVLRLARLLSAQLPGLKRVVTVADLEKEHAEPPPLDVRLDDIAFLQFTSGSTGQPKGVVLTHANLLANLRAIGDGAELSPDDSVVSWLPLYHDMGLIGCWMGSLYFGLPLALLSPLTFLSRPSRWLWTLHRHRGTLSAAPNFAYELCVAKVTDEEIAGLDLSSWRMALNGAEPVSPEAMRRFIERFEPHGFHPGAMSPVYGLAENSLALAFPPLGRPPLVDSVDRETFQRTGRAEPAAPDAANALRFVSCGFPLVGHEIRIVDEAGREVGERQEGRLEFQGPSASAGYFRNPEATARFVRGTWRDSGDRAYLAGGEVYITGRIKDVIIRAGRNLYPHELEEAVGSLPGVRKGCVAVFGTAEPKTGTERLVILAETRESGEAELEALRTSIQEVAIDLLGTPADEIVLAPPHSVPKTSSGKIRRSASRDLYASGRIGRRGAALVWQLVRLALSGARATLGRWRRIAGDLLYAGWFWLVVGLAVVFLLPPILVAPGLGLRRRVARRMAGWTGTLLGIHLHAEGLEHLAGSGPRVVVANHQSYLDGIAFTAALPADLAYVAKRELTQSLFTRTVLTRLGALFVERFDVKESAEGAEQAVAAVRGGASLLIFPEGTFRRYPGLLPFRMGAFVVAAEAGVPVVPVALRGTRSILRGDDMFPRHGTVTVTVAPPVQPQGTGWPAAIALRDAARAAILARCGEPEL